MQIMFPTCLTPDAPPLGPHLRWTWAFPSGGGPPPSVVGGWAWGWLGGLALASSVWVWLSGWLCWLCWGGRFARCICEALGHHSCILLPFLSLGTYDTHLSSQRVNCHAHKQKRSNADNGRKHSAGCGGNGGLNSGFAASAISLRPAPTTLPSFFLLKPQVTATHRQQEQHHPRQAGSRARVWTSKHDIKKNEKHKSRQKRRRAEG